MSVLAMAYVLNVAVVLADLQEGNNRNKMTSRFYRFGTIVSTPNLDMSRFLSFSALPA